MINIWKFGRDSEGWKVEADRITKSNLKIILSACYYLNYIKYGVQWTTVCMCVHSHPTVCMCVHTLPLVVVSVLHV